MVTNDCFLAMISLNHVQYCLHVFCGSKLSKDHCIIMQDLICVNDFVSWYMCLA